MLFLIFYTNFICCLWIATPCFAILAMMKEMDSRLRGNDVTGRNDKGMERIEREASGDYRIPSS
jgi:hypothetical protein